MQSHQSSLEIKTFLVPATHEPMLGLDFVQACVL